MLLNLGQLRFVTPYPSYSFLFMDLTIDCEGDSLIDWKKGPELAFAFWDYFVILFFLYFSLIQYNNKFH